MESRYSISRTKTDSISDAKRWFSSTALSGLLLRLVGGMFNLVVIPIAIQSLGREKFAAAGTLLGLAAWLNIANGGLGTATTMMVAQKHQFVEEDRLLVWQGIIARFLASLSMFGIAAILIDDSSSPLAIGELQTRAFGTAVIGTLEVPCGSLPDYLRPDDLGQKNLLKIDTQGFELQVLRGAEQLLDRFSAIYCELSFVELYVGQPLASEIISYPFQRQFSLAGVYNITAARNFGFLQADMLFARPKKI